MWIGTFKSNSCISMGQIFVTQAECKLLTKISDVNEQLRRIRSLLLPYKFFLEKTMLAFFKMVLHVFDILNSKSSWLCGIDLTACIWMVGHWLARLWNQRWKILFCNDVFFTLLCWSTNFFFSLLNTTMFLLYIYHEFLWFSSLYVTFMLLLHQ